MSKVKGMDVSTFQGKIDWDQVKASGKVDFALIRAGYGNDLTEQDDIWFERNVTECDRVGIPWGAYLYSYAVTPEQAESEAAHILRLMAGKNPLYPVCLDVEDGCQKGLSKEALTEIVYTILTRIEAAGYYAMLYANKDWLENRLDMDRLGRFDVWLAQWNEEPTYKGQFGIWQYSSRNALGIPGYGTSLDCNRVYKDYEQLMIQAGLQGHTAPTPEDTTPNKLDKQRITIGRISSGDRATIRALCEGLGLIAACLYRETCADGNQWVLDVGPVSSGDAWYIMRKCAELELIDAGLYKAEYVG